MAVQTVLRIQLANRPGEFARVTQAMGQAGINLASAAGMAFGDAGSAVLLASDPAGAARALRDAGVTVQESQVAVAWLPNRAGALASACTALAEAGINLTGMFVVATSEAQGQQAAFECSDAARADAVLAGLTY
jgi:hypothetical protein